MDNASEIITAEVARPLEIKTEEDRRSFASSLAGYFEELHGVVENLKDFSGKLGEQSQKQELESLIAQLKSLIQVIDDNELNNYVKLGRKPYKSTIDRLGLTGPVIQARENGMSIARICKLYEVTPYHVRKFFQIYDGASKEEKKNFRDKSIFNTTTRLEELNLIIQDQLLKLKDRDPKNHVLYTKQLLECIKAASDLTEKIAIHQQLQNLIREVSAILLEEIPDDKARVRAAKRLESIKEFQFVGNK